MSAPRKPHPIESLPFVEDRVPKSQTDIRRCFWNVQPTGDYGEDCNTGQKFAIEYLRYQVSFDSGGHLAFIVGHMPRETTGIEVGFLSIIDIAAKSGTASTKSPTWNLNALLGQSDFDIVDIYSARGQIPFSG